MPITLDPEWIDYDEKSSSKIDQKPQPFRINVHFINSIYRQAIVHDDNLAIYRATRDGQPIQWSNNHPPYTTCQCAWASNLRTQASKILDWIKKEIDIMGSTVTPGVTLSGALANMSYDDAMRIFNDKKDFLLTLIQISPEGKKDYTKLIEHVHQLEEALKILLVQAQSGRATIMDLEEAAEDAEREEIRKKDRAYKIAKKAEVTIDNSLKEKETKEKRLRKTWESLGMGPEEIEAGIIKMKANGKL